MDESRGEYENLIDRDSASDGGKLHEKHGMCEKAIDMQNRDVFLEATKESTYTRGEKSCDHSPLHATRHACTHMRKITNPVAYKTRYY